MILNRMLGKARIFHSEISCVLSQQTHHLTVAREDPCQYPQIIDMSDEGQAIHNRQIWYDTIKSLPSVELKLHEIAVQQLLDLKTFTLTSSPATYNATNFYSYITRTHLIKDLPKNLTDLNVDREVSEVKESFCNILCKYYNSFWGTDKVLCDSEGEYVRKLINSLIMECYKKLGSRNDYILNSTIQQNPRICSFWWHGGYGKEDDEVHEKNLCFQFEDHASLSIRVKQPLLPILELNDSLCSTAEIFDYHYHPDTFHIPTSTNKLAAIPGFWPGDPCEYPFLLVNTLDKVRDLTSKLENYDEDKIFDSVGVMSSFAWLNAIAMYQGFTPFNDVTYPFVTQAILTNGQDWRFFVYQLNTVAFHNDVDNKDRRNICWTSGNMRLFDAIEDSKVVGVNEEVFKILLQFLHNAPAIKEGVNLKPYLGEDNRSLEDKQHLRYFLRKMYSRIPDHMAHKEEVPMWVKIYKLHKDAPPTPLIRLA